MKIDFRLNKFTIVTFIFLILLVGIWVNDLGLIFKENPCEDICNAIKLPFYKYYENMKICSCKLPSVLGNNVFTFKLVDIGSLTK